MPPCIQSPFLDFYGVFWGFSPSGFCDRAEVRHRNRLAEIWTAPNPCREPHLILVPEMVHSHVFIHVQVIQIFPYPGQIAPDKVPVVVTGRQKRQVAFEVQQKENSTISRLSDSLFSFYPTWSLVQDVQCNVECVTSVAHTPSSIPEETPVAALVNKHAQDPHGKRKNYKTLH